MSETVVEKTCRIGDIADRIDEGPGERAPGE
jgi:hypothetical protein